MEKSKQLHLLFTFFHLLPSLPLHLLIYNNPGKMSKALKVIGLWLGITLFILLAGGVWVMSEYTLVNHWLFFGCILVISVGLTVICAWYGHLLPVTKIKALRIIATAFVTFVVISGIALTINYFTADFDSAEPTKAIVCRKYQQTRHRTRRSGRHSYERGEPYQVYNLDLRLLPTLSEAESESQSSTSTEQYPSSEQYSRIVKIETSRTNYSKFHKGDTVTVSIAKGFLRLPVVSPATLKLLHPHSVKAKTLKRRRFS